MSYNLGVARGVVELVYNGKGQEKAQEDLKKTQTSAAKSGANLKAMGRTATRAGLVVAAGIGAAVFAAGSFEKRMNAIKAVSGAGAKEMEKLRKKALQLGQDTAFSAGESAIAIEELVKAGITVPDVLNGAADAVVALAAAGEVELPEAASIAAAAMNSFKLSAKEMPGVADTIAGAANASAINVGDFGLSLKQVGAVAKLAGVSFEDTATAIALMGNAGIKGSDAGTSLKTMLMNLIPTTDKQKELMRDLGLLTKKGGNAFFDASGKAKSLSQISGVLSKSLKGMSEEQKLATLQTLFGADAIRGAAVLADSGAKGFDKMAGSMGKIKAADVAATKMSGLAGEIEQFTGSVETLAIQMGSILLPALTSMAKGATGIVNAFGELSPGMQKAIVIGASLAAGLLLLFGAAVKVAGALTTLSTALGFLTVKEMLAAAGAKIAAVAKGIWAAATWLLNAALAVLTSPITLIIAAIALLIAGIILLWKKNETFRNIVKGAWSAILTAIKAVINFFTGTVWPVLKSIYNFLAAAVKAYLRVYIAVWKAIIAAIRAAISFIVSAVRSFVSTVSTIWESFWSTFGGIIKAVWGLIVAIIRLYIAIIGLVIRTGIAVVKAIWTAVWRFIQTYVVGVWKSINRAILTAIASVVGYIRSKLAAIRSIWNSVWNWIRSKASSIWSAIVSFVSSKINALLARIRGPLNTIRSIWSSIWNSIRSKVSSIFSSIVSTVTSRINSLMSKIRSIKSRITGFFSGAASWLVSAGRRIIQGLIDGITAMIGKVTSKLNALTDKIKKAKGPPEKDKVLLVSNGQLIMQSLIKGLESYIPKVERMLSDFTPTISSTILAGSDVNGARRLGAPAPTPVNAAPVVGVQNIYPAQGMNEPELATYISRKLAFTVATGAKGT